MRRFIFLILLFAAPVVLAGEFRSIGETAVPMYVAPSVKAKPLFVASKFYPVEIIVQVDNWTKVRDVTGDLAWVERKSLSDTRTVVITAALADVRQNADDGAALVFQARQGVALEVVELGVGPWVKVLHRGGQTGFVRASQIWGL